MDTSIMFLKMGAAKLLFSFSVEPHLRTGSIDSISGLPVVILAGCDWKKAVAGAAHVQQRFLVLFFCALTPVWCCSLIFVHRGLVNAILAKLPPSWRDFVTSRRHMKKQLTLTELSAAINVEERARSSNKPSQQLQAHVVEKGGDRKFQKKNSPQKNMNQPKSKKMKKKKEDFICYVCGVSGAPVLMGNGVPAAVRGTGQVYLKLTSGKTLVLKDVLYGLKLVFESNKVVLSKFGTFVGKSYESGGLFRLSV
ncbi:uncharacterized protein, partial [Zea mays]|uniref:uncharacterized protein n=1 Tax=Zea mays TaxID=4577 RepID=UPI0016520F00